MAVVVVTVKVADRVGALAVVLVVVRDNGSIFEGSCRKKGWAIIKIAFSFGMVLIILSACVVSILSLAGKGRNKKSGAGPGLYPLSAWL